MVRIFLLLQSRIIHLNQLVDKYHVLYSFNFQYNILCLYILLKLGKVLRKVFRKTLEAEILKHILPKSTIYSDKWPSYNHIIAMKNHQGIWCSYNPFTVNHSKNFLNPVLKSIHTQNIERRWGDLKQNCKRRGHRTFFGWYNSSIKHSVAEYEFKCNNGVLKVCDLIKKIVK
ncbi:Conserved_hypothetical protein [Hexamita inflata]|uniref:ISXO2-like transposase domain-containing protein n=1 Tax=Hexamita inflata TaxID=28002 RepID=A0ABP1MG54_9EUKA